MTRTVKMKNELYTCMHNAFKGIGWMHVDAPKLCFCIVRNNKHCNNAYFVVGLEIIQYTCETNVSQC